VSIDINDEIVQDFLVEVGEIIEQLGEQLVSLESQPDDVDVLNCVFRGFHTIKGGAGFLALDALVDVCHKAENIFDLLRRGDRSVNPDLMDNILQALDSIQEMYAQIQVGNMPEPAAADLIEKLEKYSHAETVEEAKESTAAVEVNVDMPVEPEQVAADSGDTETQNASASNDITEEEFDRLLDELHGEGKAIGGDQVAVPAGESQKKEVAAAASDEITEDEFEALLDELQSQNKGAFAENDSANTEKSPDSKSKVAVAAVENKPAAAKKKPAEPVAEKKPVADATVRVETGTLDRIMNMVGELVLLRNRLVNLDSAIGDDEMSATVSSLDVVTADLQSSVMKTRMQPIKKIFGRFPRVVRDVARSLDKQVVLETMGEDTDLDKNLVEALTDPLIHLVRNAVDHGVEVPAVREAAGKTAQGTIMLSAEQQGDHILLKISDDGAGMDADVLRGKAVEKGLMDETAVARLSDQECFNFIFLPGFSTKEQVSDISGRGVGMDVVKTKLNQLSGTVEIDSVLGKGTTISIKVPLTLAIMPTLMVELGDMEQIFALPLVNVNEILDLDEDRINVVDGQKVILVRGKPLPLFRLGNWLTPSGSDELNKGHVVVVTIGTLHLGLLVDKLIGREEVVIKPLGALLQGTNGLTGATVTGNGKIALILDLPGLIQAYAHMR
jgi:two-component system, chemotaxis family, sensor kinase CheA